VGQWGRDRWRGGQWGCDRWRIDQRGRDIGGATSGRLTGGPYLHDLPDVHVAEQLEHEGEDNMRRYPNAGRHPGPGIYLEQSYRSGKR